jgi:hypothetical protein
MTKCPHCGKSLKGHAAEEKAFRELTKTQQKVAIARAVGLLKRYQAIYKGN